jgi:serine/threonine protein kinase
MTSFLDGRPRRRRREDEEEPRNGNEALPVRSEGARFTYAYLAQRPPQAPVQETFHPIIRRASCQPAGMTVLRPQNSDPRDAMPPIYLMGETGATQAYALIAKAPISLGHHEPDWGCVLFAVIYTRVGDTNTFQAPEKPEYVAIKQLNKAVVARHMASGGEENPYKEICRMQELGDNRHVLKCTEALENDKYLFIVTPKACEEAGTLKDVIPWMEEGLEPSRARFLFIQILEILDYLMKHDICHHDLSPDNFVFLSRDNLVAFDLALSLRMPRNEQGRHRTLMTPQGNFGTRAWQPPEVFNDQARDGSPRAFDGAGYDLWSAGVLLYNLLTGQVLYEIPHFANISYRYFLLAGGLGSRPINERTVEILMDAHTFGDTEDGQRRQHRLLTQAMAHLNLSPQAVVLLENLLDVDPSARWNLAQAMESDYVTTDER